MKNNISVKVDKDKAAIIKEVIANQSGIAVTAIEGKKRDREIVEVRQMCMVMCQEHTSLSLKSIGELFGKRDHSTVLHARRSVEALLDTDKTFKKRFNTYKIEIEKRLAENMFLNAKQVGDVIATLETQIEKLKKIYYEIKLIEDYEENYKKQHALHYQINSRQRN